MTALGVTFGSLSVLGPRAILDIATQAQELGYSSIWTVEATGTDALTLLGGVSAVAPTLDLATGIIPVQLRTPPLTAMSAATLQAMSPDANVWLGLGVSAPGILRGHGATTSDRPIAMMREYVALLRECLSGESVTFEGDFWSVKRFRLAVRLPEVARGVSGHDDEQAGCTSEVAATLLHTMVINWLLSLRRAAILHVEDAAET